MSEGGQKEDSIKVFRGLQQLHLDSNMYPKTASPILKVLFFCPTNFFNNMHNIF